MKKSRNEHNRIRSIIVNFRMSPLERASLDERIHLSGKTKQDYLIHSTLYQKIVVVGNQNLFFTLQGKLLNIESDIKKWHCSSDIDKITLFQLQTILELINGFKN